jgi:hypothetical protein
LIIEIPEEIYSSVMMSSNRLRGYDVYVDGTHIGIEGVGSDILDGVYRFREHGDMWNTIVLMKNGQIYAFRTRAGSIISGLIPLEKIIA